MKNLFLILALIIVGYLVYQHYFKQASQQQEVKDIPVVVVEKKAVKQPPKKVVEYPKQTQKKKVTKQTPKKVIKITEPKIEVVKPKPQLSQSTKTAVRRIKGCIANGRYFEAARLCETVRIPKGMDAERKYFASLVSETERGLERQKQSKIIRLETKKRNAKTKYIQQLNKIASQKSCRKLAGGNIRYRAARQARQREIDREFEKKQDVVRDKLKQKYDLYLQKIDSEIRMIKNK